MLSTVRESLKVKTWKLCFVAPFPQSLKVSLWHLDIDPVQLLIGEIHWQELKPNPAPRLRNLSGLLLPCIRIRIHSITSGAS